MGADVDLVQGEREIGGVPADEPFAAVWTRFAPWMWVGLIVMLVTALLLGVIRPFSLLLIDEPFVGLDTPGQETLVEVLADIAEQGASIICSTHQLDLVPKASRCIGLRDGEKSFDGPASETKIRELVGD